MNRPLLRTSLTSLVVSVLSMPVITAQSKPSTQPAPESADVLRLIERLGAESFADRKAAERSLEAAGDAALPQLRDAAEKDEDPEVRWRARRLVRSLEGGDESGSPLQRRSEEREQLDDLDELDDLAERLERMLGGPGLDADALRELREKMREQLQGRGSRAHVFDLDFGGGSLFKGLGGTSQGQSSKIKISSEGVRVEVLESKPDGTEETKVYEAEDVEAFRKEHPEVAEQFGIRGPGLGGPSGRFGFPPPSPRGLPFGGRALEDAGPVPEKGQRLGVYIGDVHPAVREYLELEEGHGLMVEELADEGLAVAMGIRPRDIVLSINDQQIGARGDVVRSLSAIAKGEEVRVVVLRKGREMVLKTAKQHDAPKVQGLKPIKKQIR